HEDFVAEDLQDAATDDLVDFELLLLRRQPGLDGGAKVLLVEGGFQGVVEFRLGEVELAEEVALEHGGKTLVPTKRNTVRRPPTRWTVVEYGGIENCINCREFSPGGYAPGNALSLTDLVLRR